jgi:hypothetical protein
MLLPYLTNYGLTCINENFDDYLITLREQSIKADCTWQKILKAFDY